MDNYPAALSINATCKYLSISRAGLYRLINSGTITPAKIGHRTVIRRVDADRFLEEALTSPTKPERPIRRAVENRSVLPAAGSVFD